MRLSRKLVVRAGSGLPRRREEVPDYRAFMAWAAFRYRVTDASLGRPASGRRRRTRKNSSNTSTIGQDRNLRRRDRSLDLSTHASGAIAVEHPIVWSDVEPRDVPRRSATPISQHRSISGGWETLLWRFDA
jgi:hypothetical protein